MTAVGTERISKIVGYKIIKGDFSNTTPNLPQRIAILGEANTANQTDLIANIGEEIISAKQAGEKYGYGSPIYHIMRILRPNSGGGVGGVPTYVYPQAAASGAVARVLGVTPTGTATGNGTHTLVIAGRTGVDGTFYDINIETGDTPTEIIAKAIDAVNNVLGSPVTATDGTTKATLTAKWAGLTSEDISVSVETNDDDLGITYALTTDVSGSGTPSVQTALDNFGNDWNTIVINGYSDVSAVLDTLEDFNGIPDPNNPTGRFTGTIMKPFIALTGSISNNPTTVTDARLDDVTIAICPAPNSSGLPLEAAANVAVLFARQTQDNPHLDISGMVYPDMPVPNASTGIGDMATYDGRDSYVKKGCSTVDMVNGKFVMVDFVTTYHPVGELPPQFRYCRNLMLDYNIRFGYYLLEQIHVVDHAIAANADVVTASNVIKPKQWKLIIDKYADDLAKRALIVQPSFMQDSITVAISTTNPDRIETHFKYKRSGFVRIASTTAEAGFNFGS